MINFTRITALSLVICTASLIARGATLGLQSTSPEENGGKVLVPIHIETSHAEPVASLQFDLRFDPQALQFSGVMTGDIAKVADKSAHSNLMHPGLLRVIIAGLNRTTMDSGLLAQVEFAVSNSRLATTTVRIEGAILSDPYGSSVPVTLSPNTVVLEKSKGLLQTSMVTGTASSKPSVNPYGTYRALFVALLCVIAAMSWSRHSTKKGLKR